jgi:hypothetical protein
MSSQLRAFQTLLKTTLEAASSLATVTILTEDEAHLESKIQVALSTANTKAGKTGAVIVILQPEADVLGPNTAGPDCKVRARIHCLEDLLSNRDESLGTGLPCYELAELVARALHTVIPAGAHAHRKLRVLSLKPLALPPELANIIGHEVLVEQQRSLAAS